MSDSVQPHRRQPTRLPRPWDSPGKNTGVGCHFLLQCMKVKSENEVALSDPMDCSLPGSFVCGIFQARVLEWGAIAFSRSLANEGILRLVISCSSWWSLEIMLVPSSVLSSAAVASPLGWAAGGKWKWRPRRWDGNTQMVCAEFL